MFPILSFVPSFLAHLPSSSVSKARYVTAEAISMKLGVRIPLGNTPRVFFLFSRFDLFCGLQAASLKIRLLLLKS
jgi:hypothetical protein